MKNSGLILVILKYVFIAIVIVISIIPILWVFTSSFKTNNEILTTPLSLPFVFKWQNYVNAFKTAPLAQFFLNSTLIASMSTITNLIIIGMSAYVFARFEFRGKNILMVAFSLSLLIPSSAFLYPLYLTVSRLGLYDKAVGLIIVYAGFGLPVSLYILRSFFLTIPRELEESANLDGAGFVATFVRIILPIARPGFGTAAVLQFLACWNEFLFALILTTGNKSRTLPIALYYFKSAFSSDYGAMFAATMVVIIPSITIYAVLQEQVVSGLASGAVKG